MNQRSCSLPAGHEGQHRSADGELWGWTPELLQEALDRFFVGKKLRGINRLALHLGVTRQALQQWETLQVHGPEVAAMIARAKTRILAEVEDRWLAGEIHPKTGHAWLALAGQQAPLEVEVRDHRPLDPRDEAIGRRLLKEAGINS